jgi:hypothetical protein
MVLVIPVILPSLFPHVLESIIMDDRSIMGEELTPIVIESTDDKHPSESITLTE